jgi:hypothetical protein
MITVSAHDTFLYSMEEGGQRAKQWRDRERDRERGRKREREKEREGDRERERQRERDRQTECCSKRVTAWAINLTVRQIFMAARERIILDLIKMSIKIKSKNLDGIVFLFSWYFDFSSVRQTTDMSHVSSFLQEMTSRFHLSEAHMLHIEKRMLVSMSLKLFLIASLIS